MGEGRTLLTGATGYVGGHLLVRLEEAGRLVRCLARRPEALRGRVGDSTEIVQGVEVDGDASGSLLRQSVIFDPVGLMGLLHWYATWPLHRMIFAGMLRNLARAAEAGRARSDDDAALNP